MTLAWLHILAFPLSFLSSKHYICCRFPLIRLSLHIYCITLFMLHHIQAFYSPKHITLNAKICESRFWREYEMIALVLNKTDRDQGTHIYKNINHCRTFFFDIRLYNRMHMCKLTILLRYKWWWWMNDGCERKKRIIIIMNVYNFNS